MTAKDCKRSALKNLQGKWGQTYLIILLVALISLAFTFAGTIYLQQTGITYDATDIDSILTFASSNEFRISTLISSCGSFVGFFLSISVCWVYLEVYADRKPEFGEFAGTLKRSGESFVVSFLVFVKTFLWALLFIIPGIVKGFSYAMATYIKTENPQMSSSQAINESKQMMYGNRVRLFCLLLSFIGWYILAGIAVSITGFIFSGPLSFVNDIISTLLSTVITVYSGCSVVVFYKDLTYKNQPYTFEPFNDNGYNPNNQ